jgi:hypothetical protein
MISRISRKFCVSRVPCYSDSIIRGCWLARPGCLGVFRGVFRGFSEEAKTRSFPSPSLGEFGFIGVASGLSIVAAWRIGSGRSGINIIVGLSVAKELSATKLFSIHI